MVYLFLASAFTSVLAQENTNSILDTTDHCYYLVDRGERLSLSGTPQYLMRAYDTLRLFIEQCGSKSYIPNYGYSWLAFEEISSSVQGMDTSNGRWIEYRDWLKKVLYLNSDSGYYCEDVHSMLATFNYVSPEKGTDYNGLISIIDYLLSTNRCPTQKESLLDERKYFRKYEHSIWLDSVTDANKTPFDTSAVNIDSIGFSILRGPQYGIVSSGAVHHGKGMAALVASRNPFKNETTLETSISEATMLRLEILDVLGKQIFTENRFFTAGNVRWQINGNTLPTGSLYARISTVNGDVKTIKLIKEE